MDISKTPDHVNELGVKWWLDKSATEYASVVEGLMAWVIEYPNGIKTRVLTRDNKVIYENPSLEAIGAWVDMLKFNEMKQGKHQ